MLSTLLRKYLSLHSRILFTAMLVLGFCGIPGISPAAEPQGIFEVQIKDHRDAIGDFVKLNIVIEKILVSPKAGLTFWRTGWNELTASPDTVDLTKYVGKSTARVFRANVNAGAFDAFHLKLNNIDGVLKKTQKSVPVKNTLGPVKLSF